MTDPDLLPDDVDMNWDWPWVEMGYAAGVHPVKVAFPLHDRRDGVVRVVDTYPKAEGVGRDDARVLVEQAICDEWGLQHLPHGNSEPTWADAYYEGVPVELKGCSIRTRHGNGTGPGVWCITYPNHNQLADAAGLYGFGVYAPRSRELLALLLAPAEAVEEYVEDLVIQPSRAQGLITVRIDQLFPGLEDRIEFVDEQAGVE